MTEHPLDNFDALALRNEFTAARMSQLVRRISRRAVGIDEATGLTELGPLVMDGIVRDTRAAVGAEQDVVLRGRVAERSTCRAQAAQRVGCGGRAEDNGALDAVLGFSDAKRLPSGLQNDIAPAQLENLPDTHAGLAQEKEDQPIRLRCPGDRRIESALLVLLTYGPRETTAATHRSAVGERIAAAQRVAASPAEEAAERGYPSSQSARRSGSTSQPSLDVV